MHGSVGVPIVEAHQSAAQEVEQVLVFIAAVSDALHAVTVSACIAVPRWNNNANLDGWREFAQEVLEHFDDGRTLAQWIELQGFLGVTDRHIKKRRSQKSLDDRWYKRQRKKW